MALGFFRELYSTLSPALGKKGKASKALSQLGAHVAGAGDFLGTIIGAGVNPVAGKVVGSAFNALEHYISADVDIDSLQTDVANALLAQRKRFLVVIDVWTASRRTKQ